jgi:hypothetical protein
MLTVPEDTSIYLRFQTHHTISEDLIRFFTWSDFSHVDAVFKEGFLGALPGGVQLREYSQDGDCLYARVLCPTKKIQKDVAKFLQAQIGKPYDFEGIAGILFRQNSWHDINKWFCSELIAAAFSYALYRLLNEFHLNRVTPQALITSVRVELLTSKLPKIIWEKT